MDIVVCPRTDFTRLANGLAGIGGPLITGASDAGCGLVETVLSGGAPWGFTLRGGREHGEPLLITKVEEGSKAAVAGLQVGDELVSINSVPLSGFRLEAICLVKSSHKTLTLTLKRRNDPASRPHSWHSSKVAETQTQRIAQNTEPEPIWQSKYSISSSSNDVSKCWDPAKQHQAPNQPTTVQNMEAADPCPLTDTSSVSLPPSKHLSAVDLSSGTLRKRDSPHATLSTSSNSLDPGGVAGLSKSQAASLECMFYRGGQSEAGGQLERPRYLQLPVVSGCGRVSPRLEEQVGSRYSSSSTSSCVATAAGGGGGSRANINPVWNVPEAKKPTAPSPPPPPPPLRSDSFAATKVHEKGLTTPGALPGPDGPSAHPQQKAPQGRSAVERLVKGTESQQQQQQQQQQQSVQPGERGGPDARHGFLAPQRSEVLPPYLSAEDYNANQIPPSKPSSLSSSDGRQGLAGPDHQRQHSDESSHLSLHPKGSSASYTTTSAAPKHHSVGGYYRSLQELPTNTCSRGQARTSTASLSSNALDQSSDRGGGGGHVRYYCYTPLQQPTLTTVTAALQGCVQGKPEAWRDEAGPVGTQRAMKNKYPAVQQTFNGYGNKQASGQAASESLAAGLNVWMARSSSDERERMSSGGGADGHHGNRYFHGQQQQLQSHREPPADPWVSQDCRKICPQQTPLLHSLSQENKLLTEKRSPPPLTTTVTGPQDSPELGGGSGKQGRRSDRYATTLRNEIIIKRAQLQKSRSAAALSCPGEADDEAKPGAWKSPETSTSSSDGSFSNTYKDHLKEAQARVLQATSFKRKDLELPGSEGTPATAAMLARRDLSVAEILSGKAGAVAGGNHVSRIGSRKRFPMSKRVHSFSEPDKINEVGVEGKGLTLDSVGSFIDRRMFFEGVAKPTFSKPAPKTGPQSSPEELHISAKAKGPSSHEEPVGSKVIGSSPPQGHHAHRGHLREHHSRHHSGKEHGWPKQELPLQQRSPPPPPLSRLGTFAEYEATWNMQRKQSEARSSGRYRSAENILEPSAENGNEAVCVHERSRSSPSADFYEQKMPLPARKLHLDRPADTHTMGVLAERGLAGSRGVREHPAQPDHFLPPSEAAASRTDLEKRDVSTITAHPPDPRYRQPTPDPPPYPDHLRHVGVTAALEQPALPKKRGTAASALPQRLSPPRVDTPGIPVDMTVTSLRESSDLQTAGHSARGSSRSPGVGLALPVPAMPTLASDATLKVSPCPEREAQAGRRLDEEWRALHQTALAALEPSLAHSPLPHPHTHPHGPASSPAALKGTAALTVPTTNATRSPSPQFAPQRLTDKPPAPTQDDLSSDKMGDASELSNVVKRVPVRIVHAETSLERKGRQYLLSNRAQGGPATTTTTATTTTSPQSSFAPQEQSYSLFCAYSRQEEAEWEAHRGSSRPPQGTPGSPVAPTGATLNGQSRRSSLPAAATDAAVGDRSDDDVKREELARDIMGKDKSLADILDQSRMRTTMDLMGGIFPQGEQVLEGAQQRRRVAPKQTSPRAADESRRVEDDLATAVSVVSSSSYYSTSAPKAELLIKMKDMQEQMDEQDSEDELDYDLSSKKQELISSLSKKLQVLHEARESLQEDVQDNNALGQEVEATVQAVCKPNELDKFRMFIGDLDKVVSLLLSLSGRLARVENALNNLEEGASAEEKHALTEKRRLLIRQHEDAKELKENLDRRERLVYDILASYLSAERLADYEHFVKMKSALIIEQRKLEDKIKLGEEQLKCLRDSLPLEQRLMF
ncbi:protein Shroom2 [Alosa pseudoharengus]|uniref:protein Shroom2 n=1 Tax=Alosa pseudoharengus TaxID=34774 RepID=UPI003F8B4477